MEEVFLHKGKQKRGRRILLDKSSRKFDKYLVHENTMGPRSPRSVSMEEPVGRLQRVKIRVYNYISVDLVSPVRNTVFHDEGFYINHQA